MVGAADVSQVSNFFIAKFRLNFSQSIVTVQQLCLVQQLLFTRFCSVGMVVNGAAQKLLVVDCNMPFVGDHLHPLEPAFLTIAPEISFPISLSLVISELGDESLCRLCVSYWTCFAAFPKALSFQIRRRR